MKTLPLVGVLLLAGPPLPVRAQVINSRDLTDVANDRPFSALNLNRADAAELVQHYNRTVPPPQGASS